MPLYQWSTTPNNNANASTGVNWAEGQLPSTVNNSARQMMADVAQWYAAPEWLNYGLTPTYVSATQFTVAGNQTATYQVNRRVRAFVTAGTVYGTITASAYTTLTTVTVTWDSGALDSGVSEVDVHIVDGNFLIPASNTTFDGSPLPAFFLSKNNRVVDSIAALRALSHLTYTRAQYTGYYQLGDGATGDVYYDPTDTTSGAYFTGSIAPITSPAAPTLTSSAGGTLAATTYYVKITYVTAAGETLASGETSLAVAANNVLGVTSPAAQAGATGYNVYVSTATGTETKQNSAPIAIGTGWTEPTTGLIAGAALPAASTAGSLLTVSAVTNGTLAVNQQVNGAGSVTMCYIAGLVSGTGGTGTYTVTGSQTVASQTLTSDNGGTYFVAFDGARWKLSFTGNISIRAFGVMPSNTDNTWQLAAIVSWASTFSGTAVLPRILIPSGIYPYATSPNWGVQGIVLSAQVGAVFKHTGSGSPFTVDGGASGGGVFRIRVEGGLRIQGNANSTYGMYNRAVHHSYFDMSFRDIATAALQTAWCVSNEYRVAITPIGDPAFAVVPASGFVLDKRGTGELTSDCTFYNPIAEGITSGYGISLQNAVQCVFIGGTSESNSGGVSVSGTSTNNKFINMDMEQNTTADIFCQGLYNMFDNCLSSTTSTFAGQTNLILSGVYNTVSNTGINNEFVKINYASNGGAFTDSGTNTIKRSVRNATSGNLDAELDRNPHQLLYINGPASNNTVLGSADQLVGGSANDVAYYHYGVGKSKFYQNNFLNLTLGQGSIGFFGAADAAKPTVSGAKGGNAALGSLLSALSGLGLITDSTTA